MLAISGGVAKKKPLVSLPVELTTILSQTRTREERRDIPRVRIKLT